MTLTQQMVIEDAILRYIQTQDGPHYADTISNAVTDTITWDSVLGDIDEMDHALVVIGSVWRLIDYNWLRMADDGALIKA